MAKRASEIRILGLTIVTGWLEMGDVLQQASVNKLKITRSSFRSQQEIGKNRGQLV